MITLGSGRFSGKTVTNLPVIAAKHMIVGTDKERIAVLISGNNDDDFCIKRASDASNHHSRNVLVLTDGRVIQFGSIYNKCLTSVSDIDRAISKHVVIEIVNSGEVYNTGSNWINITGKTVRNRMVQKYYDMGYERFYRAQNLALEEIFKLLNGFGIKEDPGLWATPDIYKNWHRFFPPSNFS